MTIDDRDDPLRERFAKLREEEQSRAPDFDATLERARRAARAEPMHVVWPRLAAAALVIAASGAGWLAIRGRTPPRPAEPVWAWRSPTQSLLDVPGVSLSATMPSDMLTPMTGGIR